jgi:hypothetical protein
MENHKACQQLVEAGAVAVLATLIKSENADTVSHAVRTLSELWIKMNKRYVSLFAFFLNKICQFA